WAGTWGGGVSHYDGKTWTNYTVKDGLAGNIVYSVAEADDGVMWFGTSGGLTRFDGKKWSKITRKEGLVDNHIYAIAPTRDGKIWAGGKSSVMLLAKHE
ncbi:MAG: two-component regulator propeller domain-containing protein, partial [Thiohalomonadales bacterium]